MKQIEIEVDADTFDSAFNAESIAIKQKDSPNQVVFYAADLVWREDEIVY